MNDYLGGYFSQKFFDSEIYDLMYSIPEVKSYLDKEWNKFKSNRKNKVPKDAKMTKIWAKKAIFDNTYLRDLVETAIISKYKVEFDDKGHILPGVKRPIEERSKYGFNDFYQFLEGMRNEEIFRLIGETDIEQPEGFELPVYLQERIKKNISGAIEKRQEMRTPLEKKAKEARGEYGTPKEHIIAIADDLIFSAGALKDLLEEI